MPSPQAGPRPRTALFAGLALVGFAANSLLCRLALGSRRIDAATFTSVRLLSGALVLALLLRLSAPPGRSRAGSWPGALALFLYAAAFSFAYLRLTTGTGALILFGVVQVTMIGWGLRSGERLTSVAWAGLGLAVAGLVLLTLPGLTAPDPLGAGLMALAGLAWGVYSLLGRRTGAGAGPLATTAWNFARCVPMTALLSLATQGTAHASPAGLALATASGALASGVGYSLWYAALRDLPATRAAIAQLAVPALAAAGGILLLGERLTPRLGAAGLLILAGVLVAILRPTR